MAIERPRLSGFDGKEQAILGWEGVMTEDWLGKWALQAASNSQGGARRSQRQEPLQPTRILPKSRMLQGFPISDTRFAPKLQRS